MHDTPKSNEKHNWKQMLKALLLLQWLRRSTKDQDTCGVKSDIPTPKGSKSSNIARYAKDITLEQFIACSVDGNYSVLGQGTPEELFAAWLRITGDYYGLIGDEAYSRHLDVIRSMAALQMRKIYIDYSLHALEQLYIPEVCELLRADFPKFKLTKDTYKTEIGYIRTIEKRNEMRMDELEAELKQLEKTKEGKATGREDYLELLLDINKHEGSHYTTDITAELFAICIRRLKNTIRRNAQQHK